MEMSTLAGVGEQAEHLLVHQRAVGDHEDAHALEHAPPVQVAQDGGHVRVEHGLAALEADLLQVAEVELAQVAHHGLGIGVEHLLVGDAVVGHLPLVELGHQVGPAAAEVDVAVGAGQVAHAAAVELELGDALAPLAVEGGARLHEGVAHAPAGGLLPLVALAAAGGHVAAGHLLLHLLPGLALQQVAQAGLAQVAQPPVEHAAGADALVGIDHGRGEGGRAERHRARRGKLHRSSRRVVPAVRLEGG
jgi:hypothetical protein